MVVALTSEQIEQYHNDGFLIVRQLFSPDEIETYKTHYENMRVHQLAHMDRNGDEADPLYVYPRLMQPHRTDDLSLQYLIDERINSVLTTLLGASPYAVQTMFYFKPPQARGQALHQDQYFLRAQPGTCMAAWLAVDECDTANGCLRVVRGSHTWPLLCTEKSDPNESFSDVVVPIPDDAEIVAAEMQAGDVLFFNGQVVHGSLPNATTDRFRRSLIAHYILAEADQVHQWYHPALRMDGTPIDLGESERGGTCGVWVNREGIPQLEYQPEDVNG